MSHTCPPASPTSPLTPDTSHSPSRITHTPPTGRGAPLPPTLVVDLLAALATLDAQPAPALLQSHVDAFWQQLPALPLIHMQRGLRALSDLGVPMKHQWMTQLLDNVTQRLDVAGAGRTGQQGAGQAAAAAAAAVDGVAGVLCTLASMQRATPNKTNRRTLDVLFARVADLLPVSGPLTAELLDCWDKLVPL